MADISKIKLPNGTTYTIKDSTARTSITNITNGTTVLPYTKVKGTVPATISDITNDLHITTFTASMPDDVTVSDWTYKGVRYGKPALNDVLKITGLPTSIGGMASCFTPDYITLYGNCYITFDNSNDTFFTIGDFAYSDRFIYDANGVGGMKIASIDDIGFDMMNVAKPTTTAMIPVANLLNGFEVNKNGDEYDVTVNKTLLGNYEKLNIGNGLSVDHDFYTNEDTLKVNFPKDPMPWDNFYSSISNWWSDYDEEPSDANPSPWFSVGNNPLIIRRVNTIAPNVFEFIVCNPTANAITLTGNLTFQLNTENDYYGNQIEYANENVEYFFNNVNGIIESIRDYLNDTTGYYTIPTAIPVNYNSKYFTGSLGSQSMTLNPSWDSNANYRIVVKPSHY